MLCRLQTPRIAGDSLPFLPTFPQVRSSHSGTTSTFTSQSHSYNDNQYDLAVVGGGIVGVASALEIARHHPNLRLIVLEKEPDLARHQTGRNSGVIHAGIYYKNGSLKARLCVAGSRLMYDFCDANHVPYKKCGKLVVAVDKEEVPRLRKLFENGQANNVPGLELITDRQKILDIEPHCTPGIEAIFSPETGIVNYKQVTMAMADLFCKQFNGRVQCNFKVDRVDQSTDDNNNFSLTIFPAANDKQHPSPHAPVHCKAAIFCAGLEADRCAQLTGGQPFPAIVPFRGDYLELRDEKRHLVRGNIYPVPDPRYPFLGVHFTPRMDGKLWLGPTAVLAFKREGYALSDFDWRDFRQAIGFAGFWRMATRFTGYGLQQMYRAISIRAQVKAMQRYIPELRREDVVRGPAGVRAQAIADDGSLVEDFVIDCAEPQKGLNIINIMHVRNAPSPAATSSLAIAKYIREFAEAKFNILQRKA